MDSGVQSGYGADSAVAREEVGERTGRFERKRPSIAGDASLAVDDADLVPRALSTLSLFGTIHALRHFRMNLCLLVGDNETGCAAETSADGSAADVEWAPSRSQVRLKGFNSNSN